jgi:hypothetical protein
MASYGMCRRNPPIDTDGTVPQSAAIDRCGEWADASITPEQEEWQKFVRQIFLAMTASEWGASYSEDDMWKLAGKLAAAEPQIQREGGK